MRYRTIGTHPETRREVSVLSLGTMHFGTATGDSPDGMPGMAGGDLLSYLRAEPQLAMVAYSPLLKGGYVRQDKLDAAEFAEYGHPGTPVRLAALAEVAKDAGATVNQVVLAWLIGAEVPMIPLVGASSVAQLDESLAAVDLELTTEQRTRLDAAP
jgi:aryl-alcohol dehydrogenase-like predicted oxidoreductase